MVEYLPITEGSGNLRGICPECDALIHRRVSLANLKTVGDGLEITFTQAPMRIRDCGEASVNCGSNVEGESDDDAQCQ